MVEGRVLPEVTVSPSTLFLGSVGLGETVTKKLVIQSQRPFRITSITLDDKEIEYASEAAEVAKPLHLVPVALTAPDVEGSIVRVISIRTDICDEPCDVSSYAVVQK